MKRSLFGVLALVTIFLSFTLVTDVLWALKNVCPNCTKVIDNVDLTECPFCGKVINKCLICGTVNPIKNDNCEKCSASLAESRVSRTISKETREDLRLGESPRAKIDVELQQIDEKVALEGLTPMLAARQVELMIQMGWWSMGNALARDFVTQFPNADQNAQVAANRVTALRHLGFLALEAKNNVLAKEYLNLALSIDPKDKDSQNLLDKMAGAKPETKSETKPEDKSETKPEAK